MRPFKYGCVVTGDAFCPRPALQKALVGNIRDGQNVVLVGERRMGKTSLVYVDLLNVRTTADVCNRVVDAAGYLSAKPQR